MKKLKKPVKKASGGGFFSWTFFFARVAFFFASAVVQCCGMFLRPGAPSKPVSMPSKPPDVIKLFKEKAMRRDTPDWSPDWKFHTPCVVKSYEYIYIYTNILNMNRIWIQWIQLMLHHIFFLKKNWSVCENTERLQFARLPSLGRNQPLIESHVSQQKSKSRGHEAIWEFGPKDSASRGAEGSKA